MSTKAKRERLNPPPPKDMREAAEYERKIGELLRQMNAASLIVEAKKRELDNSLEKNTTPIKEQVLEYARALYAFAEANRKELTKNGIVKTVQLDQAGDIRWYDTPGKVEFRAKASAILQSIRRLRLVRKFVRKKPELNKQAMLADPELALTIPGIEILRIEKFSIRPVGIKTRVEREPDDDWTIVTTEKDPIESQ